MGKRQPFSFIQCG